MITVDDLQQGVAARVGLSRFGQLADKSLVSLRRDIKNGRLRAIIDPGGRLYIEAPEAIRFLRGEPYQHDHLNVGNLARMERARLGKRSKDGISGGDNDQSA